uniref:Uncharacterized protein AlNc14C162G7792 n=1 Tax=Albugo laibachii Nc14 TaxID=890382 RepID=F0WMV6_9STRA|nr:conserved hypothetical protein [Albugo laibachii Nc14]|eukprot:CCA22641.1 conserved hypothetical protein [Albugo laibachii Nc14]
MFEEEEFGRISDDTEVFMHCNQAIMHDHPDFTLYNGEELHALSMQTGNALKDVLKQLPEQKDLHRWKVMTVQLRPDRSWPIIRDLITTVCMTRGLLVSTEHSYSVTYTRRMIITPFSHTNMMTQGQGRVLAAQTEENIARREPQNGTMMILYVQIGVSASKLRVLTLCTTVYNENKFLNTLTGALKNEEAITRELHQILVDLQSLLIKQYLPLTNLFMKTPENTTANHLDEIALDEGYTADVRRMYQSEMKQHLRELCIPLEEYAYDQEYACALLLGLLDPLLKKHAIDLQAALDPPHNSPEKQRNPSLTEEQNDDTNVLEQSTESDDPMYGQIINRQVHELWHQCEQECNARLKQKICEKKHQISAKANSAKRLRRYAIESIIQSNQAEVTTLRPCRIGDRLDVLLYECTCMINTTPSKLHVTYGGLIYQTLIPFFSKTVHIPITNVEQVAKSQTLGIRMISLREVGPERKTTTIAKGIEIDLLYELLVEIHSIHSERPQHASEESTQREEL